MDWFIVPKDGENASCPGACKLVLPPSGLEVVFIAPNLIPAEL